jgi:protein required for attachment to host cells
VAGEQGIGTPLTRMLPKARVVAEVNKDLTKHAIHVIEKHLVG